MKTPTGWQYLSEHDETETYTSAGQLQRITNRVGLSFTLAYTNNLLASVTDIYGRTLRFAYNSQNQLSSFTDPAGNLYRYTYNASFALQSVNYPDQKSRQYVYEDARFPYALTGIIDENNQRYAKWTYDAKGRAQSSQHANGADGVGLVYNADGSTLVSDATGALRTYRFTKMFNVTKNTAIVGPACDHCGGNSARTYDANGFVAGRTDFNGNQTNYTYNARGLETNRTEAVGKPEARSIATE